MKCNSFKLYFSRFFQNLRQCDQKILLLLSSTSDLYIGLRRFTILRGPKCSSWYKPTERSSGGCERGLCACSPCKILNTKKPFPAFWLSKLHSFCFWSLHFYLHFYGGGGKVWESIGYVSSKEMPISAHF